ncbi:MAG: hypothetical protein H6732_20415 [Alphaproteobacteria bacterium]|nr:hypothetical protein [Alphaproteobacteria bacterium]
MRSWWWGLVLVGACRTGGSVVGLSDLDRETEPDGAGGWANGGQNGGTETDAVDPCKGETDRRFVPGDTFKRGLDTDSDGVYDYGIGSPELHDTDCNGKADELEPFLGPTGLTLPTDSDFGTGLPTTWGTGLGGTGLPAPDTDLAPARRTWRLSTQPLLGLALFTDAVAFP